MSDTKINVLVTGCGGDIGQSIGKILNESDLINNLYGCDISDRNAAKFIFTNFFIGLPCNNSAYLANLESYINKHDISLVIPVSEPELRFFSKNGIREIGDATLIMASKDALEIGFDKLMTSNFLKSRNLPYPVTHPLNDELTIEKYPVILKSRTGSGSSQVSVVRDYETFKLLKNLKSDFIVQEYLDGTNGEFTCGLFRSMNGVTRSIILKRELIGGFTGYAEVVSNDEITSFLHTVAEELNLVGSINIQLRLTNKGPVVFEINPRFSSTVRFRDLLGFKDVLWSIEEAIGQPLSDYKDTSVGRKMYKGFNEYIQ